MPRGAMTIQFRVLGSVEAHIAGRAVDLGPARQRCVLVALLLDANHVVPVERLMSRAWDGKSAHRGTLYSYVSRLRSALHDAKDVDIARRSGGYLLTVDPMNVDLHRFRQLINLAHRTNDPERAAAQYAEALGLWRGEAFAGLDAQWLDQLRASLDLERRAATLDRNDLMLRQGMHAEVLAEFAADAADHRLDERLAGQLMLALHQAVLQALPRIIAAWRRTERSAGLPRSPPHRDPDRRPRESFLLFGGFRLPPPGQRP